MNDDLLARSQYLDQLEQEIAEAEKENEYKAMELMKTSKQVSQLANEIRGLKQQTQGGAEPEDSKELEQLK